jgi:hypothetical protein
MEISGKSGKARGISKTGGIVQDLVDLKQKFIFDLDKVIRKWG